MTKRIAAFWTDTIIRCDKEQEGRREIISYGMEIMISTMIGVALMLAISLLAHEPLAWLLFLLAFVPLRHTAGGYHANTHFECYAICSFVFFIGVVLGKIQIITSAAALYIVLFSAIIVFIYSPCVPDNKPISSKNRKKNRTLSIIFISFDVIIAITFYSSINIPLLDYFWGVLSASLSLVAAKIKVQRRRIDQ